MAGQEQPGDPAEQAGRTELKLYNDKGAWSKYFEEMGAVSKQQIGLSMTPVGYTDEPTYQAFIKASFRTSVKPDLFTWTTGGRLQEIVAQKQVADTTAIWQEAVKAAREARDKPAYEAIKTAAVARGAYLKNAEPPLEGKAE